MGGSAESVEAAKTGRSAAQSSPRSKDAARVREVRREHGSFDEYLWSLVGGEPIVGRFRKLGDIPAETAESKAMSKDLKKRGFRFVGPTVCYAFMQACGLAQDHTVSCFRYRELAGGI